MSDLISIIVPAYNSEKWLTACCESVLHQTHRNIELIVVNDGSTDGTRDLLNGIARYDERIRVIHTENGGVCRARNIGLDAATGDYIAFLDADDLLMANALEMLYSAMQKEMADITVGWKTNIRSDGTDLGCPYDRNHAIWVQRQALEQALLDHPATYTVWGKLYRKELIRDIRFVEGKKVHEDSFFVFECFLKQPKVVVCDDIIIRYRLSENSASRGEFSEKIFDILYFAERKQAIIEKEYPEYLPLAENMIVKANMALLWNLLKTKDPKYKEAERLAIRNVLERRQYYRTAIKSDAKLFWILTHRLYTVYKILYRIRAGVVVCCSK